MLTVNIHDAKTQLSRLVDRAAKGESFIIAKAGRSLVKVVPLQPTDTGTAQRLGFMSGEIEVPEDFDRMGESEIEAQFSGLNPRSFYSIPTCCSGPPASRSACPSMPGLYCCVRNRLIECLWRRQ